MTYSEFITAIETYYNLKYEIEIEIKIIIEFLKINIGEDKLEAFFHRVTDLHSKKWKSLPDKSVMIDVLDLEKHRGINIEIQAEKAWLELLPISSFHDVLIVDPISHYVVSQSGSWHAFCEARDGEYRELTRKDFIERYVRAYTTGVDVKPYRLPGHMSIQYSYAENIVGVKCRIVGEQATGHRMLSETKLKLEISATIKKTYHPVEA